jgi:TonB family protein
MRYVIPLLVLATFITSASAAPVKNARPVNKSTFPVRARPAAGNAGAVSSQAGRDYSARLWNKILARWNYPDGNNNVIMTVTVAPDGSVENLKMTSSPRNAAAESAAQAAVDAVKPLEALPGGASRGTLTISFNSKSDPHGDSSCGGSVRLDTITGAAPPAASAPAAPPATTESAAAPVTEQPAAAASPSTAEPATVPESAPAEK